MSVDGTLEHASVHHPYSHHRIVVWPLSRVSGSLSRIDTKPKLSQRGSRRNLNRGLPSRSRLRLTQLETASTGKYSWVCRPFLSLHKPQRASSDSGESDQDDAVSEITDFSSGRRRYMLCPSSPLFTARTPHSGIFSRGIPHAASFSLGSRGSRHQFSTVCDGLFHPQVMLAVMCGIKPGG